MSRTTQQKFFDRLEAIVGAHKLDLRVDYSYANVGKGFIEPPDSLNPVLIFTWDHSGNYFRFNSTPVALEKAEHGLHRPDDGDLDTLLARIDDHLTTLTGGTDAR